MTTRILDGRATRDALIPGLIARVKSLSHIPTLVIIQVGNRPDSTSYIRAKKSLATKIGVNARHIQVSEDVAQTELINIIKENNVDKSVDGIIVQLPLPLSLDRDVVIETIDPCKDVDALTSTNVKRWLEGREDAVLPATARGVRELLKHYGIELFGQNVVVVGRSMLVGKPVAAMCLCENATVAVCHSKTPDLAYFTKNADILIVAAGKPGLIGKKHVCRGQVVVDVGINTITSDELGDEIGDTRLVGDVDFEAVHKKVAAITPVPGGVGPMTVFALFENLIDLCSVRG